MIYTRVGLRLNTFIVSLRVFLSLSARELFGYATSDQSCGTSPQVCCGDVAFALRGTRLNNSRPRLVAARRGQIVRLSVRQGPLEATSVRRHGGEDELHGQMCVALCRAASGECGGNITTCLSHGSLSC